MPGTNPFAQPPAAPTPGGNMAYHNYHNDFLHVANLNERRRLALAEVDKASFGWSHVRACVVAGVGFFTDSYDIFTASLLTIMLGIVYYPGVGKMPAGADDAIKLATSAGIIVGQLVFGFLADVVGRKKMYGLELIVIIFATFGQSLTSGSPSCDVVGLIIFWRVMMGVGIGGDYPLSSIITAEFAATKWRGAMMSAVFAMQGFGQLAAAFVMIFVTIGFQRSLSAAKDVSKCSGDCQVAVDKMWRLLIGFGAVPACIALYFRLTIPETPRYTFDVARDTERGHVDVKAYIGGNRSTQRQRDPDSSSAISVASRRHASPEPEPTNQRQTCALQVPRATWRDFRTHYSRPQNAGLLLGTAGSWFVLDVAFYGLSLNNAVILDAIGYTTDAKSLTSVYQLMYNTAVGNLIIVLAGAVPGYWVSVATMDILGRKTIQMGGFAILTVLFLVMGFSYTHIDKNGLLIIYVLAHFFFNFGPNTTTFVVPGEVFPTRYRATSHGLSAAAGKIGSLIGQGAISTLRTRGATAHDASPWMDHVMEIYALFMLIGCLTTLLIPETKRKTLEELCGEDDYAAPRPSYLSTGTATPSSRDAYELRKYT